MSPIDKNAHLIETTCDYCVPFSIQRKLSMSKVALFPTPRVFGAIPPLKLRLHDTACCQTG